MQKKFFGNKKLTIKDLRENDNLYEINLEMLIKSTRTPEHIIYAQKEKELNARDKEIREYFKRNGIKV